MPNTCTTDERIVAFEFATFPLSTSSSDFIATPAIPNSDKRSPINLNASEIVLGLFRDFNGS
jgi:hypothetical protein